jgi:hypothetical protein
MPWGAGNAPGRANGALMSCLRAGDSFDICVLFPWGMSSREWQSRRLQSKLEEGKVEDRECTWGCKVDRAPVAMVHSSSSSCRGTSVYLRVFGDVWALNKYGELLFGIFATSPKCSKSPCLEVMMRAFLIETCMGTETIRKTILDKDWSL